MTPLIGRFRYRAEIDGLRALAILAVLFFHAGCGFPGGYVGVDVFFVISGFLITSLIWKDLEQGRFTFLGFWEKRARRLFPALLVVTASTLIAGWFLLLPSDFKNLGQAAASQILFAANIYYYFNAGYFSGLSEDKPLLHTWSLAVEEQFYFIVPFLLCGLFKVTQFRTRKVVATFISAALIASLAASIYGIKLSPSATFYLLPTRSWELLLGSLVAVSLLSKSFMSQSALRNFLAFFGLALIAISVFFYTRETPFPGLAALPPCAGTALIIWATTHNEGEDPTWLGRILSLRPITFTGTISYSLYLWHWPIFAYTNYYTLTPLPTSYRVGLIVLVFFLAILTWKYIETPFRKKRVGATRFSLYAFTGIGLATIFSFSMLCIRAQGFPQRLSTQRQIFSNAKSDMSFINELTTQDVNTGKLVAIGVQNLAQQPSLFVWGDSHAMAALPAIDIFLKEKGWSGRAATHSSTAPVLGWYLATAWGLGVKSVAFNDSVFAYIRRKKIRDVLLVASWSIYIEAEGNGANAFSNSLVETIVRLKAIGVRPWVLLDVPRHSFDVPKSLSRPISSPAYLTSLCTRREVQNELEKHAPNIIARLKAAGGHILDPKPEFLDATSRYYIIQSHSVALYRDKEHLTTTGAKIMLLPYLRRTLKLEKHLMR